MTITIPIGESLYELAAIVYPAEPSVGVGPEVDIDPEVRLSGPNGLVRWISYPDFLERYAEYDDSSTEAVGEMVEGRFVALAEDNRRNGIGAVGW